MNGSKYFCPCLRGLVLTLLAICRVGVSDGQDTNYVQKYDNIFNIKLIGYNDGLEFKDKGSGLNYIPDLHSGVGIGVYCKYFPFDFSIKQEVNLVGNDKYHKKKTTDMQLKGYTKYFAGDIFIQKYEGFYTSDVISYKSKYNKLDELSYNPDISVFQIDAVGKYIFNHEKFSYKAGFTSYEKQKVSAGSPTAGMALNYLKISADSSLVKLDDSKHIKTCNLGINAGYAYNFVFGKRSLLFVSSTVGVNASNLLGNSPEGKDFRVSPAFHSKMAYWLDFNKWAVGITGTYNIIHQAFDDHLTIYMQTRRLELLLIRRLWYPKNY